MWWGLGGWVSDGSLIRAMPSDAVVRASCWVFILLDILVSMGNRGEPICVSVSSGIRGAGSEEVGVG